jgi:prefoldin subunit 5
MDPKQLKARAERAEARVAELEKMLAATRAELAAIKAPAPKEVLVRVGEGQYEYRKVEEAK